MMKLVGGRELWLSILRRGEPVLQNVAYATYVRAPLRNSTWASGVQTGYIRSPREHCEQCKIDKFRHW
jgi:hypothetical protein